MEPVVIYPGTNLVKELPPEQLQDVLEWFRANGVDPNGIPQDESVTIDQIIDFWWLTTPSTPNPEGTHALEQTWGSGEYPRSHHQIAVSVPMPDDMASVLRDIADRRDAAQAELTAKLSGLNLPCPKCGHER